VARAKRTTKTVAQRIDMHYFKRPSKFRRLRFFLSLLLPALGVVWLAGYGLARNNHVYSSGRMAPAHAVLTQKCSTCHETRAGFFNAKSNDQLCLTCHDGPVHHASQNSTPACSTCHVEHRGLLRLASTADESCAQCHSKLQAHTASGGTAFARDISSFGASHPEFAALRAGFTDPGTVKLNHAVHLKIGLLGPNGPVQLTCEDCHRANTTARPWRFPLAAGSPPGETPQILNVSAISAVGDKSGPPSLSATRAYLGPIFYAKQCAGCHALRFDRRIADSVPHDTPEVVHAFVVKKLTEYIAVHPGDLREAGSTVMLPGRPLPVNPRVYNSQREWIDAKVAEDEQLLWGKTCKQCHALSIPGADGPAAEGSTAIALPTPAASREVLPVVAKSNITPRWFQHAVFDHDQHRLVNCESCHTAARTSVETADVLLPSIKTCQQCHHSGADGAESRCFECHIYHDWKTEKEPRTTFTLTDLMDPKTSAPAEIAARPTGGK
jgi:hypothetical protein